MHPTWHKFDDPPTGVKASKTAGWTADSFSGGLEVTFTECPAGTKAVLCAVTQAGTLSTIYIRASGDTNISNTPNANTEYHCRPGLSSATNYILTVIWLSGTLKAQFAVTNVNTDLYVVYPQGYLL